MNWMIEEILFKCCQQASSCPDHGVLGGSFLISYKQQAQERQKKFPGTLARGATVQRESKEGGMHILAGKHR